MHLTPERRKYNLSNAFVQVDFDLIPTVLGVTIGSKIEHHELTDYELQPNVRVMWHPRENHSVWAAVSRAVRTPSRGERDGIIFAAAIPPLSLANPTASTLRVQFEGESGGTSESVVAYELGWRSTIARHLTVDIATFYNSYSNLINGSYGQPTPDANFPAYLVLPITIQFDRSSESYGFELSAMMTPIHSVTTRVGYTYLWTDTWTENSGTIGSAASFESPGPRHQVNVHTTYDLNHDMSLASTVRYVDDIPSASIDSYMELDLHASYRIYQGLELFVTGNDLLAKQHLEYRSEMLRTSSEVQRRVFTGINWRF